MTTTIGWTHVNGKIGETVNPQIGCDEISPGCRNCYAAAWAHRGLSPQHRGLTKGIPLLDANGDQVRGDNGKAKLKPGSIHWNGVVRHVPAALEKPLRWRKPRGIFWGSLTDLFHKSNLATDDGRRFIAACFGVMAATPQHTHIVLTKRPGLMREWFKWITETAPTGGQPEMCVGEADGVIDFGERLVMGVWPLPNVWLMTTTEDQQRADERIADLLACPAAVHGLSVEPMLGPVDLSRWIGPSELCIKCGERSAAQDGDTCPECKASDCLTRQWGNDFDDDPRLDWVITGGESGPRARPPHPDWFRRLRDQCTEADIPFFFKQWGALARRPRDPKWTHMVHPDGRSWARGADVPITAMTEVTFMSRVGKKTAGRELDGREWNEFPDV